MLPTRYVHARPTQNERSTQRELAVTRQPSLYAGVDSFVVGDQVTWMLPAIAGVSRTPRLKKGGQNYTSFVRRLVTNSGLYALSSLAVPFVSLTLSPFLTHALTSDDYGALAILT